MGRSETNMRKLSKVSYLGDTNTSKQLVGDTSPKRGGPVKKKKKRLANKK